LLFCIFWVVVTCDALAYSRQADYENVSTTERFLSEQTPGLGRGERAPDFVLPLQTGTPTRFYGIAGGKPTILIFCDAEELEAVHTLAETLINGPDTVPVLVVKREKTDAAPDDSFGKDDPFPIFSDAHDKVRNAYRLNAALASMLFVLDPNLRVLESFQINDPEINVRELSSFLDTSVATVEPLQVAIQAPVLLIPNVLNPEICQDLIKVWQNRGSAETGVEQSEDGGRQQTLSHDLKRRRDHVVMDRELLKILTSTVGRRVMPEVQKSFAFKATRFEGFKIVCYDAAFAGFFHAHRDNLSPATAHRRFALSLNLNRDYDGGHLRFPEYGPHLYRPEAGSALVFSCSHLHEVTEVTKGQRFALLSFLFGEANARVSPSK
jgi:predicted 2-oxoglutarate/Fe(II)-dependent dioxygenase YbiX